MGDDPSLPMTTTHSRDSFTVPAHDPKVRAQDTASLAPSEPHQVRTCPEHDAAAAATSLSAADGTRQCPSTPLRISTDVSPVVLPTPGLARRGSLTANVNLSTPRVLTHKASHNSLQPVSRTPSLRSSAARGLASAGGSSSVVSSPVIAAIGDMTPLPSPLSSDSPGPWRRLSIGSGSPPLVRARLASMGQVSVLVTNNGESVESAAANAPKRKMYATLDAANNSAQPQPQPQPQHRPKNHSVSGYIPDAAGGVQGLVTASGSNTKLGADDQEAQMRRELNYAESRGLTLKVTQPPTPPPSESSRDSSDGSKLKDQGYEYFEARARGDRKMRHWRSIGFLGQGTFSQVILATSQAVPDDDSGEPSAAAPTTPVTECSMARRRLVAVKVCEHDPRGGASEERVKMSLKRELEILQSINHPSLVNLKAWSIEPTRAILVLNYSPGGDLFEVATAHRAVLTSSLLRRMFAELVGAVQYLHQRRIVHRDIKLENVLVNLSPAELADPTMDWATLPQSVVTLTDLGLSRRIADYEKLETRCGSDDYAAPEVIMGQPYDGRAIDAWSLGVLLYALLEARLPFDPHPGMSDAHRMRSRTSHRIARVEWRWIDYGGQDGDHEGDLAKFEQRGLMGAMEIAEGLLQRARSRWSVERVTARPWVRDAVQVDGGLQFWEEDEAEEV